MKVLNYKELITKESTFKKSKFITYIVKINSKKELQNFIEKLTKKDARHNCYAYKIGFQNNDYGYDNDGEPNGTAGEPLLKLIEHYNLTNILIFVVRYFGGIKLGTGGLQKAYSFDAIGILKEAELKKLEFLYNLDLEFKIENIKQINLFLNKLNIKILNQNYLSSKVCFNILIDDLNKLNSIKNIINILNISQDYY